MINTPTSEILSGMVFLPWVLGSCKLSSVLQLPDDDGVGRKIDFYLRRKRGPGRRRPIRVTLEKGGEMNPLHKSRAFFPRSNPKNGKTSYNLSFYPSSGPGDWRQEPYAPTFFTLGGGVQT